MLPEPILPPPTVIKVKMPESPDYPIGEVAAGDDLVWVWDTSAGVLRKSKISDLPFGAGGGGGGGAVPVTTQPSPFMVFNDDENYSYDPATNTVTIRDTRLKNRTMYPVFATQIGGGELNPELIIYNDIDPDDDTKGRLIISNFQLEVDQHLTLIVPGDATGGDSAYAQLKADVAFLKLIAAPFIKTALGANGGKVFWGRPASEIPPGWQEYTAMRGTFPMAQDPDDEDFDAAIGTTAGAKSVKLVKENIPELDFERPRKVDDVDRGGTRSKWSLDDVETGKIGTPDFNMKNVELMNPYRIIMWIEFVGI
ncbi:hypothetical protein [Mucilaginibacter glaciei]|uniref:Uncharacterized protein n=1 Tax=Mucilaginibacter glaciei TaxID=2772109 RepID=A0A926S1P2_9SPHI|nr:hypothetical protein [Mucilaginibacter glaciei]MBD1394255.1 hypothetical protein [Mucilaginibacter glaciei]